jgi:hypothetical protein
VLHRIYLMRWRRQADFDSDKSAFDQCVDEYRTLNPRSEVSTLEISPWRAYGPAWSEMMRDTLERALRDAGGG